jgi:prepilin-type N-terminal cleavage/methylation domain-containing protein
MNKKSGFSLIELAIVILIVGFLVAAATVGMSLAGKMQSAIDSYQVNNVPAEDRRTGFSSVLSASAECTGGNSITKVNGKTLHTFTSGTGVFKCPTAKTVSVLVVGGGGGGGNVQSGWAGGGGGAGGLIYQTNYSIIAEQEYPVTVGALALVATTGNPSSFGNLTAQGGGRGVVYGSGNGGSGSGASNNGSTVAVGLGTAGQGYNGGKSFRGIDAQNSFSGGGGGACSVGVDGSAGIGGDGGDGCPIDIDGDGTPTYYAGGGGGGNHGNYAGGISDSGNGGLGGGAGRNTGSYNAAPNTGGGGAAGNTSASKGGSGIVIVAY